MLKIIECNQLLTEEYINQYIGDDYESHQMQMQEGKYTIESINDYQYQFSLSNLEDKQGVVGVIIRGDLLSEYHQNKLLKLFEDSRDNQIHLIFIDRADRLLDTIVSRGIVISEQSSFVFEDNQLHNFGKRIIKTSSQYQLMNDDAETFRILYKINANLQNGNINQAILNLNSLKLNKDTYNLFVNLVYNYLYETKRNDILTELFEIELRTVYQVNYNLQAIAMLITINGKKEYYERSDWSQKRNN